jgi:hypothetical protein
MPFGCGCARCADANVRPAMACLPWSAATRATATFRGSLPGSFSKSSSLNPAMAMPSATNLRASCSPRACSSRLAFAPDCGFCAGRLPRFATFARQMPGCPNTSPGGGRFGGHRLLRGGLQQRGGARVAAASVVGLEGEAFPCIPVIGDSSRAESSRQPPVSRGGWECVRRVGGRFPSAHP